MPHLSQEELKLARQLAASSPREYRQIGRRPLFVVHSSERKDDLHIVQEFDLEFGDGIDRFLIVHIPRTI